MRIERMPPRGTAGTDAGLGAAEDGAAEASFLSMIGDARTLMQENQGKNPAGGSRAESGREASEPCEVQAPAAVSIAVPVQPDCRIVPVRSEDPGTAAAECETMALPVTPPDSSMERRPANEKAGLEGPAVPGSMPGAGAKPVNDVPEIRGENAPVHGARGEAVSKIAAPKENPTARLEPSFRATPEPWNASGASPVKTEEPPPGANTRQAGPVAGGQEECPEPNKNQAQATAPPDQSSRGPVMDVLERILRIPLPKPQAPAARAGEPVPAMNPVPGAELPEEIPDSHPDHSRTVAQQKDASVSREGEIPEGGRKDTVPALFGTKDNGRPAGRARVVSGANNPNGGESDPEATACEPSERTDAFERISRQPSPGAELGADTRRENRSPERFHLPTPAVAVRAARTSALPAESAAKTAQPEAMALHEPDFLSKMAQHVQIQVRGGDGVVHIQLKPQILGRLEIRAETFAGGVRATIVTESQSVRDFLEQNIQALRQSFQDQGIRIERMQIMVADPSMSDHAAGGQSSHQPSADRGTESRQGRGREHGSPGGKEDLEPPTEQAPALSLRPHSTFHTVA